MGACGSAAMTPEQKEQEKLNNQRTRAINQELNAHKVEEMNIIKLLLLGAGESGKSTLFKQLMTIYGKGFSDEERKQYTNIILQNCIASMKTLVFQSEHLSPPFPECKMSPSSQELKRQLDELKESDDLNVKQLTEPVARVIAQLWQDPGIKATVEHRSKFQLPDSAPYFFDRVMVLARPDYVPDQQDILRCRARTTGIVENAFTIGGNQFKMFDVGGQRNERKKWIHCFENVTAVLFVVAASEYDQLLYEDETTNRMVEALNLFEEMCNSRYFRDTSMILFLNKKDLFEDKVKRTPLGVCFPDYRGSQNPTECINYLASQFNARNHTGKEIYTHSTCATDIDNVSHVFGDVKDIIIRKSLAEAGLTGPM